MKHINNAWCPALMLPIDGWFSWIHFYIDHIRFSLVIKKKRNETKAIWMVSVRYQNYYRFISWFFMFINLLLMLLLLRVFNEENFTVFFNTRSCVFIAAYYKRRKNRKRWKRSKKCSMSREIVEAIRTEIENISRVCSFSIFFCHHFHWEVIWSDGTIKKNTAQDW